MKSKIIVAGIIIFFFIGICSSLFSEEDDEWHNYDGSDIVCRVNGCGNTPEYSKWEDRFCSEHLNKSTNHSDEYDSSIAKKKVNTEEALSIEEADSLRGTGYHNTRPNSSAENSELKAAMVKCKKCGMHSDNGANSLCDECRYNEEYGFD